MSARPSKFAIFSTTRLRIRKFLKGSGTEFGHISDQLLRTALPHPTIAFKLAHNGRVTMELPATSEVERQLAAWPDDFREQRLPIESRDSEIRLRGIIGLPEFTPPLRRNTSRSISTDARFEISLSNMH